MEEFRCDGKQHCSDNSDEANCKCLQTEFQCLSGECLAAEKLCDGQNDCLDGSDEKRHCSKLAYIFVPLFLYVALKTIITEVYLLLVGSCSN